MFPISEQLSTTAKANFEAQVTFMTTLANQFFQNVEKVIHLNVNVVKASLEESTTATQQLMSAKNPQELLSSTAAQTPEKVFSYTRHLANIVSNAQTEFTKAAEIRLTESSREVIAIIEETTKNAPIGSENVVSFIKSVIGNANAGYEQFSKNAKQATEVIETNLTAVNQLAQAAGKTGNRMNATAKK